MFTIHHTAIKLLRFLNINYPRLKKIPETILVTRAIACDLNKFKIHYIHNNKKLKFYIDIFDTSFE